MKSFYRSIVVWNLKFWEEQKDYIDYEVRLGLTLALPLTCCVNLDMLYNFSVVYIP